jgi:hypothetical protein
VKTIGIDARRYAWCRGHALWIIGMPAQTFVEDVHGAEQAGQDGLVRYAARMIGDACAVALTLALHYERPIPSPAMRSSWALERVRGHELWQPCWELIRGIDDLATQEIVERCDKLIARVRAIVGEIPDILTPEGYYPAIAMARDWLKLMDAVGEQGFLPKDWTRSS